MRFAAGLALLGVAAAAPVYRSGAVTRPDGAVIAYHVREGAGPDLVLIPGSFNDHRVFDRFVDRLPAAWRVIVVELRGHGGSQPAASDPSMSGFADDVLAAADALGLRRFHVGGHSIGGMLAIELAGRRPKSVASVISIEGWTHHLVAKEAFGGNTASTMTAEQQREADAHRAAVRSKLTDAEAAAFASVWRRWDGLPVLRSTPVPVLEIWGDRGRPRPSRALLRIPERANIELVWIAGASHPLLIEAPETVADHVARFIARVRGR